MRDRLDRKAREAYQSKPCDVIQYSWGGLIAYLQRNFQLEVNDILDFADSNGYKNKAIPFAEHIFALIYEAARNLKLGNVRHIRNSKKLSQISGILQHDLERIEHSLGKNKPELTDIDLELLAHQFICSIQDRDYD